MGLDVKQFREFVVRPALQAIGLWSEAAEELVTGTCFVESSLNYVKQVGGGPAVGIAQIEPATYKYLRDKIVDDCLDGKNDLSKKICNVLNMAHPPTSPDFLIGNLTASVIFCRLKYYLNPDPLPAEHDYAAMAAYHKKIYNTPMGDADVDRNTRMFRSVVLGYPYHG